MSEFLYLSLLVFFGSVMGLLGGLVFLFNKNLSKSLEENSIPFAAGVLLTVSFLGLLPEAVEEMGETAYFVVLISFFIIFIFEKIIVEIHHHGDKHHGHSHADSAPLVIIGDTIHNLIDGLAIGASFIVSPSFGLVTAFSSFLHEIPHEVGDFGVLLKSKWKKTDIVLANLFSAAATFIGAYSIFFFDINETIIGFMLAISAGIFLYLGAIDFLPQVLNSKKGKFGSIVPLVLGAGIMIVIFQLFPHAHE